MIIKIANTWANWLVSNGANSEDHDVYVYGAECMLNEIFSDLILILIALLLHKVFEMVAWVLFFTPLRVYLGGAHASSHMKCIISSVLLCFLCIYGYIIVVDYPILVAILLGISFLIVYKIAPVVHPNHPVSELRMQKMRKYAIIILCVEIAISITAYVYFSKRLGSLGTLSIFSVSILGVIGKLHSFKSKISTAI